MIDIFGKVGKKFAVYVSDSFLSKKIAEWKGVLPYGTYFQIKNPSKLTGEAFLIPPKKNKILFKLMKGGEAGEI